MDMQLTDEQILKLADSVELPYTIGEPSDGDMYLTWPDRVVLFARALLSQQVEAAQWVSVKDRLPEKGGLCLVFLPVGCDKYGVLPANYFEPNKAFWKLSCAGYAHDVTHWMPLPAAPDSALSSPAEAAYTDTGRGGMKCRK